MSGLSITWRSPGPVAEAFLDCRAYIAAIMGPVGSAKTTTALMRLIDLAKEQAPSRIDNKRKFKACVVCKSYRTLWKNLLPSWWHIMTKETGDWHGSEGGPATHKIDFALPDGTMIEFWIDFIAIGENRAEDILRGYEPTVFLLEEADLLDFDTFQYCVTRAGRWPKKIDGGPTYRGVALIFNAPDTENYCYAVCVEKKTPEGKPIDAMSYVDRDSGQTIKIDVVFYRQPGGMDPGAENLANLPSGYYETMVGVLEEWLARRLVHNRFGYSRAGKPVYPEYNDNFHVAPAPIKAVLGLPLILGLDAGGSPALVTKQRMPNGQWRTLAELVSEQGTGPERFGDMTNRLLADRFPDWASAPRRRFDGAAPPPGEAPAILAAIDPSAFYGGDEKSKNDQAWAMKFEAVTGLTLKPAPTNLLIPRLTAVRQTFSRNIDGATPGYLMDPGCTVLRKAYSSDYRYLLVRAPGATRYHDEPEKGDASHPADADQYAMLTFGEFHSAMGRREPRAHHARPEQADMD